MGLKARTRVVREESPSRPKKTHHMLMRMHTPKVSSDPCHETRWKSQVAATKSLDQNPVPMEHTRFPVAQTLRGRSPAIYNNKSMR